MQNILINGDCLIEMNNIKNESIDMILCDLPYGTTKCRWDLIIPLDKLWEHYNRIIKTNGVIALFGSEPFSSHLRLSNQKNYKYDWYWHKDKGANIGNSRKMPLKIVETISIFYKKLPFYQYQGEKLKNPYKHTRTIKSNLDDRTNGFLSGKTLDNAFDENGNRIYEYYTHATKKSLIYFARESSNKGKSLHPTQKPVKLLEFLIKTYTNENDVVLDNCMGSGSTIIASLNTNRNYIGIEKDEEYYKIAENRIKNNGI